MWLFCKFTKQNVSWQFHAVSNTCKQILPAPCSPFGILKRHVVYNKITKNKLLLNKTRDSAFENIMDDEKKINIMRRIIQLLLKQPNKKMLFRFMLRRGGYVGLVKPQKMGDILQKYPRIVRIYRNPNEMDVWVTLANPILQLLEEEKALKLERCHFAAERLRKVLMLSTTRRIRLDRVNYIKEELGLPDDFKNTVIKANPDLFGLVISRRDLEKGMPPSVKLLDWDPQYAIPAIEQYQKNPATTSGLIDAEYANKMYSFPVNLPPGFKIKKGFRLKLKNWQELPYRSPYADTSDLDLQSPEAFKRAVAVIHEFLHITVEKRTRVDRLAHLREDYKLPQKLGITVLQNPGIFYLSIKGNSHTIFLREGYRKGQLIDKDATCVVKENFLKLIRMGTKSMKTKKTGVAETDSDSDTSEDEKGTEKKCPLVDITDEANEAGNYDLKTEDEDGEDRTDTDTQNWAEEYCQQCADDAVTDSDEDQNCTANGDIAQPDVYEDTDESLCDGGDDCYATDSSEDEKEKDAYGKASYTG